MALGLEAAEGLPPRHPGGPPVRTVVRHIQRVGQTLGVSEFGKGGPVGPVLFTHRRLSQA